MSKHEPFDSIEELATKLRDEKLRAKELPNDLKAKRFVLIYAYNGTGKTRLSMAFKDEGKKTGHDTLYFNAFTEDLFTWDNDLDNDTERVLKINEDSKFFGGIEELAMEGRIKEFLHNYADFGFKIDYIAGNIAFSRSETDNIKISRGEENIFIWCFFLAIVQLAIDGQEKYTWVKYIYIDDPISSLDDNNAIAVAHHLVQLLKSNKCHLKTIISTHHTLFFNVLCNELKQSCEKYFLHCNNDPDKYILSPTGDTPFFQHIALLAELQTAVKADKLYTYHFNILRNILEKTAAFHGLKGFSACIKQDENDTEGILHTRIINILNHGKYSLFEPVEMLEENKNHFEKILNKFLDNYKFNTDYFSEPEQHNT